MEDRIAYACKYTPLELLRSFGLAPEKLNTEAAEFGLADASMHANVCCHAKAVMQQAAGEAAGIFTDCCDSMRRVYDVLTAKDPDRFLYFMELPHNDDNCAKMRLAHELERLVKELETLTGRAFDPHAFIAAFAPEADSADGGGNAGANDSDSADMRLPHEPFFAVMGARATTSLLEAAEETLGAPVVDLTCASYRNIAAPPDSLADEELPQMMMWYAHALFDMLPCMRMCDVSDRRVLAELPNLAGIIYNTVKFCDYYGFDYEKLSALVSVPILKVESDYQPAPAGQLSTRLEALRETAGIDSHPTVSEKPRNRTFPMRYVAGIDSGSTTTNMVALDAEGTVCASTVVRTGAKAERGAKATFDEICAQLDADPSDFAAIVATGYGRANIQFATSTVTEITCHARGAHTLAPQVRSIVDIGGQDSKIICLDEDGNVSNFVMNDKCAAGTGRFLEAMARTVEMPLEEMARCGLNYKQDVTISSMCTVFAESEVISLIADNIAEADIVHGLNNAIASRTASMAARAKATGPFMMTGGVARNPGVVAALEEALDADLFIPKNPDLCGALGAALFALDEVNS